MFVASSDGVNSWVYVLSTLVNDFGAQKEEPLQMSGKIVSMARTGGWTYLHIIEYIIEGRNVMELFAIQASLFISKYKL